MGHAQGLEHEVLPPHPALRQYYAGAKWPFVRRMFDHGAADYDRVERIMALGTGSWYRRQALLRAGLRPGMRVLDMAVGTGLVAREAMGIVGEPSLVLGVDPSSGMLGQTHQRLPITLVQGTGEQVPLADGAFDFVSMGYALRHLADLNRSFREFARVLKPGGTLCVLEMTPPRRRAGRAALRLYMRYVVPCLSRLGARHSDSPALWRYFWDTVEACVEPQRVMDAMRTAGFAQVQRHVELGVFSEYTARKAAHGDLP
jgi:demethylmenaquinone methyltransferase/2-methoxy-6-polyprenyl-1,4-benzoquinol methylase